MNVHDKYKVDVPVGKSGDWTVEKFIVSKKDADFERMRSIFNGGRFVPEGTYTALKYNGYTIMSDTPDEIRDHLSVISYATGNVLINGLGLGMVLNACLKKLEVTHVTVIEISEDVISLVGDHYKNMHGDRLSIVHENAFEYKPPKGTRYDTVWHDIWSNICADNLKEMHQLHRKYGRFADWQGSWGRYLCEKYKRSVL